VGGANDFHTVRRRYQKVAEHGFDKDSANRFLRKSIEQSKQAAADESYRYKPMNINWEELAKDGIVKKTSERNVANKIERAKKLTQEAYDRADKLGYRDTQGNKLDITKPQKQQ